MHTKSRISLAVYTAFGALLVLALVAVIASRATDSELQYGAASAVVTSESGAAVDALPMEPRTVSAPEIQLAGAASDTAKKTAAFAGCIFGVGVPIGLAWGIATNPAAWAWVANKGPFPASVGAAASKYMNAVKRSCAYALR